MSSVTYEGRDLEAMSFAQNYHQAVLGEFAAGLGLYVGEVGAGSGNFTELLLTTPLSRIVAVEPSLEMYPLLQKKFEDNSKVSTRQDIFSNIAGEYAGQFDTMVYVNVLEHIEDETLELSNVYAALKPGGAVCIFVPALPFLYSKFDASVGHYRRYQKLPLKALVESAGFTVEKCRYFDFAGILPWYLLFTLGGQVLGAQGVSVYDRWVVPVTQFFERLVPPPLGKNLLVIARKPK